MHSADVKQSETKRNSYYFCTKNTPVRNSKDLGIKKEKNERQL